MLQVPEITKDQEEKIRLWLYSLEMERTDKTWLRPKPVHQPLERTVVVTKEVPRKETKADRKAREARDRLFFNAGRYSAGARDKTAISAMEELEREGLL